MRLLGRIVPVSLLVIAAVLPVSAQNTGIAGDPAPTLQEQTLGRDIDTAGFYELVDWLRSLDQPTSGDRATLARRLREYYGLPEPTAPESEGTPIIVKQAARTRYFTLADMDERYVKLSGGVTLTLRDDERDVSHQIVADEVTYNQDLNILSASGDVIYTLDRGGTVEQFFGEALTVQLDDWDGAFVQGVTKRSRTIEGEEVDFSFAGRYITRSADDVVVMEDGRVTSSVAIPPNYEIHAEKIWVLAPGEWGLRNAVLYVGRVGVFYFPFFFKPGNELFFNPSVGRYEREGRYTQTTTYLLGQPEKSDAAFSFLQIAEEQGSAGSTTREGLYLVPDEGAPNSQPPDDQHSDATLRLLADYYTKLGAYAALDGSFPSAGPFNDLSVYLGLGMSRNIYSYDYSGQGTTYSPYYLNGEEAVTSWNGTQLGSVRIPFRFGLGLSAALSGTAYRLAGDITMFSDGRFKMDFDRRSEQIDWLGLVGQGTPLAEPAAVTSYEWTLKSALTPQLPSLSPWIQRAAIQNAAIALRWRESRLSSTQVASLLEDYEENGIVPEWPDPLDLYADDSPEIGYFYPDTLQSPTISAVVSGQLLNLSSTHTAEEEEPQPVGNDLRAPWQQEEFVPFEPEEPLRLPQKLDTLPAPAIPELWKATLGYTVSPTGLLESKFNSDQWNNPQDIDFSLAYSAASGRLGTTVPLSVALLSNQISLTGSLSVTGQYRTVFNEADTIDPAAWQSLLQQAYSYSSANSTANLSLKVTPFTSSRLWSRSSITYSVGLLLYQLVYSGTMVGEVPQYDTSWIDWTSDEFVRSHQVQLAAALDVLSGQELRVTADIWPRTLKLAGQLNMGLSPISIAVGSGIAQEDDLSWTPQPLTSSQTVDLGELGSLQNQISYDWEPSEITYDRASAKVGPVTANVEMRTTEGFLFETTGEDLDGDATTGEGWVSDATRAFQPTKVSVGANATSDLDPLWHNRLLLNGSVTSSWQMDLLRYTESSFSFGLKAELEIPDFLTLSFSSLSANTQSYVYIGPLAEGVGRQRRSLAVDLLRSFNFFNRQDRVDSAFNLQQIEVNATHYLEDWDLNVTYSGRPEIVRVQDADTGVIRRQYDWQSRLDVELQWRAIRELSSTVRADNQTDPNTVTTGSPWDLTFGNDS